MAKVYGSFCGALLQSAPPRLPQGVLAGEFVKRLMLDSYETSSTAIGTQISLGKFNLESVLDAVNCIYYYDALGSGVTLEVGDTVTSTSLATAASAASAGSRSLLASVDIADYPKPLWQQLGYASLDAAKTALGDRSGMVELIMTVRGAAATGTVTWRIHGCEG